MDNCVPAFFQLFRISLFGKTSLCVALFCSKILVSLLVFHCDENTRMLNEAASDCGLTRDCRIGCLRMSLHDWEDLLDMSQIQDVSAL